MAVKGPNGRDPLLDVYDVPPSVEKSLPPSSHHSVRSPQMLGSWRLLKVLKGMDECVHWVWDCSLQTLAL